MTYGTKLRKLREAKGYSQGYVANAIGVNQSNYSRLESDLSEAKVRTIQKLAQLYQVDISEISPPP